MTWPIVELTFWNPGDGHNPRIDPLLADPTTPLAKHGLTGIATAYARETGAELHAEHQGWAEHLTGRSLGVDGALGDVVELFDREGFDYFIAKGPVIAHTLYPEPGMRPYCDLDVYVAGAHHEPARLLLMAQGFEPVHHAPGVLGGLPQELHGGRYGTTVELHAHVVDNLHRRHLPPVDAFLPHVERQVIAGVATPSLSASAHLALQAIHAGAGHRYGKLALLRDVELSLAASCAVPAELGALPYLPVLASLLRALDRTVGDEVGVERPLARAVVRRLARQDPASWDEYRLSTANVLALLHQGGWQVSGRNAVELVAAMAPRRHRRIGLRRPARPHLQPATPRSPL